MFKVVPGSCNYTEFFIPEMNLNIVPFPDRAVLKGSNAHYYKVSQVSINLNHFQFSFFHPGGNRKWLLQQSCVLRYWKETTTTSHYCFVGEISQKYFSSRDSESFLTIFFYFIGLIRFCRTEDLANKAEQNDVTTLDSVVEDQK